MIKAFLQAILLAAVMTSGTVSAFIPSAAAQEVKAPETAEEHLAMAKMYEEKAATYRKEVEYHRQMLEAYKKSTAASPKVPNPWIGKMQKHCTMLAKDAEKMAKDADVAAGYHKARAAELQNK